MRKSVRGILIENGKLLTIYREKIINNNLSKYYVLPGGGIENGENNIDALKREFKEETSIEIMVIDNIFYTYKSKNEIQYFYFVTKSCGTIMKGSAEEYRDKNKGYYEIKMINLNDLSSINLVPAEIKEMILKDFSKWGSI